MRYRARRTVEEQRRAIEPMMHGERVMAYLKQNTPGHNPMWANYARQSLTPRQMRRLRHKSKLGAAAWNAGTRPA